MVVEQFYLVVTALNCIVACDSLSGYVSSCVHGEGRNAADRQFLFVNKRPCDNSKVNFMPKPSSHWAQGRSRGDSKPTSERGEGNGATCLGSRVIVS